MTRSVMLGAAFVTACVVADKHAPTSSEVSESSEPPAFSGDEPPPEQHDEDGDGEPDPPPPPPPKPLNEIPQTLADTGFFEAELYEFQPRWPLWSDGAAKRRWIALPPGTKINTTEADYWLFPVGTKLWKEFRRDGVLVETRYMVKHGTGDNDWLFVPYKWIDDSTALAVVGGAQNVRGTPHDIPSQDRCSDCHANTKAQVLGFSAFQLDYAAPSGLVDFDDARTAGWLSSAPGGASPHWPVPGTQQQKAVLGYFHANCGHCHNSRSQLISRPALRLESGYIASFADTKAYRTTVNIAGRTSYGGATIIAKPGDPDHSIIITRMRSSDPNKRMPWLGGEVIDQTGLALVTGWINSP